MIFQQRRDFKKLDTRDIFKGRKKHNWFFKLWYWKIVPVVNKHYYNFKYYLLSFKYGFDVRDTWNLDYSCAKWLLPRLKYLRKHKHGYPASLKSVKEWNIILNKIIKAFELSSNEDLFILNDRQLKQQKEGLELFAKHYRGLWD